MNGVLGALGASWAWNTGLIGYAIGGGAGVAGPSDWASAAVRTVLLILAAWRLSYMFVMEDGPWLVFTRFRGLRGIEVNERGEIVRQPHNGTAWFCINCMSMWVALWVPFMPPVVIVLLAMSAMVIWFRRHTVG